MKTLLVPIDFSKATDTVINAAVTLAEALHGRIVLLHIVQPLIITSDYGLTMENFQETITTSEKYAAKRLAELSHKLAQHGTKVETVQVSGPAQTGILEQAEKKKADYIIMGSHGHGAIYDLLIGSTTQGVLRRATCPVLVVPGKK